MKNEYESALENFFNYCDEKLMDQMIAEEGAGYKFMRKSQTSSFALKHQLSSQRSDLERKYNLAVSNGKEDELKELIQKRKDEIVRKLNGSEIKKKKWLQKMVDLYDEYLRKL